MKQKRTKEDVKKHIKLKQEKTQKLEEKKQRTLAHLAKRTQQIDDLRKESAMDFQELENLRLLDNTTDLVVYEHKPLRVRAIQYDGSNKADIEVLGFSVFDSVEDGRRVTLEQPNGKQIAALWKTDWLTIDTDGNLGRYTNDGFQHKYRESGKSHNWSSGDYDFR